MMNVDPKVQRIIDWRESFVTLPDNHFFELIRMYLGKIHSPFNKQKLVEQLGVFLHKDENRKKIVNLLSETDLLILTAVYFIPKVTNDKLSTFFTGTMNFASLYERLLNLEERLLIYRHADKSSSETIIDINPILEDVLLPLISKRTLLPRAVLERTLESQIWPLSQEKIASFVNYIHFNPSLCKADGTLKKRDLEKLEAIFGSGKEEFFQLLMTSFINLSLVKECPQGFEINRQRINSFAELDEKIQYAYICVSSKQYLSRNSLLNQAKLLLGSIYAIPPTGFTKLSFIRSSFLIGETLKNSSNFASEGRFASMLARAIEDEKPKNEEKPENSSSIMESLCDSALVFGLLKEYGIDENGNVVIVANNSLLSSMQDKTTDNEQNLKVLSIDPAFNITLFPGLNLKLLLPLMNFLELKKFDTAATFTINRKSVMASFDRGLKLSQILNLLEQHSLYSIPENLSASLDDWSKSYSSASLYKGYILKIDAKNTIMVEKNPVISKYIYEVLAPGLFLLNVHSDEEAENLIRTSGLDYIGKIQEPKQESDSVVLQSFDIPKMPSSALLGSKAVPPTGSVDGSLDGEVSARALPSTEEERKSHFDYLRGLLDKMNITVEQREGLLLRINRKIILTPSQLNADSVKLEQIEANGMDFQGKVHVAESAITQNMMLELEFDTKEDGVFVVVGTPILIDKSPEDSTVRLLVEPKHEEQEFSLGKARNVRRIRGNVFK